jgi:hypothetical protein
VGSSGKMRASSSVSSRSCTRVVGSVTTEP